MALEDDLICCADAYCAARGIARSTLSNLMLNDSTTLDRVAGGGSLTVRNWQRSMDWLSTNWPESARWPKGIARPPAKEVA